MKTLPFIFGILSILLFIACNTATNPTVESTAIAAVVPTKPTSLPTPIPLSTDFKKYWYAGKAEITSYELQQARYGELRSGKAVLIYVTEDFLPTKQVKADYPNDNNIPVLKLNATKKFTTGIYPYSIMQSTFYPVAVNQHAIKVSSSMQEWCGHMYTQLNNREQFDILSHSYFQGEADQQFSVEKQVLENELWNQIRIQPATLPTGTHQVIPSFEFCRLRHKAIKGYQATITKTIENDMTRYTLNYPELDRTLSIVFQTNFPHQIQSWTETYRSGFGTTAQKMTTTAIKIKSIQSDYWDKNGNQDAILRNELGL